MSIKEKTASHVQTLLINLSSGPFQQPTELLKLSSQGCALSSAPVNGMSGKIEIVDGTVFPVQGQPNGRHSSSQAIPAWHHSMYH